MNIDHKNEELVKNAIESLNDIANLLEDIGATIKSKPDAIMESYSYEDGSLISKEFGFIFEIQHDNYVVGFKCTQDSWYRKDRPPRIVKHGEKV